MKQGRSAFAQIVLPVPLVATNVAALIHAMTRLGAPASNRWLGLFDSFGRVQLGLLVLATCAGLYTWVQAAQWPRGTRGRGRLLLAAFAGPVHLATGLAAATLGGLQRSVLSFTPSPLGLDPEALIIWSTLAAIGALTGLAWLGAGLGSWPLLDPPLRRRLWAIADVVLLGAAVSAIALLPAQPLNDKPHALELPILRHVITTLAAMRLTVRALPPLMNTIESLGYHALIAARHLRAKKSGFLAVISMLAVMAVTVSSCALTTTLSVMGGFRNDLKRKILGNNAHVIIDREHGTIEQWQPLLSKASSEADVIGAAPYVSGEVMLSSASNLATAVLRGVDPERVGSVSDLPNNIRSGKLEYLKSPETLLHLPPTVTGKLLSPVQDSVLGIDADADRGKDAVAEADAGRATDKPKGDPSLRDSLAEFLIDDKPEAVTQGKAPPQKDALPGIIIGQELARSLRLYLGDEVNVVAPLGALGPTGPMPKSRPFRVAGIFYSGMYEYDMKYTYVTLETAQRFLNVGDAIHGIEVKTSDTEHAPAVATRLRKELGNGDVRVRDWQEVNSRLFGALALEKLAMFIALGIAILVASFCIAATLMLMVQEKGRQIAVLKAIGSPDRAIVTIFVLEGLMIGAFGSALGLFLGYMVCFAFEHFGVKMNPEVYYIDKLPVHIEPSEFVMVGIASVLVCLLVTIYPAVLGSRLRPVDALRYE